MEQRNERKSNKKWLVIFLLLFVVLTTATAFAYWAGVINAPSDEVGTGNVGVGVAGDVDTVIEITPTLDDGVLVPEGRATGTQVEALTYRFDVTWTDEDDASHGALGTLLVNANANHTLLNVAVSGAGPITAGVPLTVTITVTLAEPANKAEYDELAGNNFTLNVEFSVTPTP